MKTVCEADMCNGCMACLNKCTHRAIRLEDSLKSYNMIIDETECANCNLCYEVCPRNDNGIEFIYPQSYHQGWTKQEYLRSIAASGGVASSIMSGFVKQGGSVCSCLFANSKFVFVITDKEDELKRYAGSKYVKSSPEDIYKKILSLISDNIRVLFIGLPCQVAAIKKYIGKNGQHLLYTVDLICHGTPSPQILEKYLSEHGYNIESVSDIQFRSKTDFDGLNDYKPVVDPGIADRYLYTYLKSINYTENCYNCQYAQINRISDLTIGDSWGSTLSNSEQNKGISLILVQNAKGQELLEIGDLELSRVDLLTAMENNGQLKSATQVPLGRKKFMEQISKNKNYDWTVFQIAPIVFIKQDIKQILFHLGLLQMNTKKISYGLLVKTTEAMIGKGKKPI